MNYKSRYTSKYACFQKVRGKGKILNRGGSKYRKEAYLIFVFEAESRKNQNDEAIGLVYYFCF